MRFKARRMARSGQARSGLRRGTPAKFSSIMLFLLTTQPSTDLAPVVSVAVVWTHQMLQAEAEQMRNAADG
ncbi:hypothetical protein PR202_ga29897 [Eleusine coracana subsp. coracana]|uniref:Uncharacterized protein n=1 Tax=Eleusine coracana subsp. coracana TaxID=191504 RepID=A0AAV5DMC6_ELECO|nr:hypothetical protein PR202_ga29897 [Eleusine coracana subsp. coracana]